MSCGGGSPTEPSAPGSISSLLQGQTVNAIDGAPAPNLTVRIGTRFPVTSDGSGFFQADMGDLSAYRVIVEGGSFVERETRMNANGGRTRVSVIPSSFDLAAYDEMFRTSNSQLQRWTARPSLVILASVMVYRDGEGQTYEATASQLSDADVEQLRAHLTEGLAFLTGGTYTTFASVDVERPAAGASVNTLRSGHIVVGRYTGIMNIAKTIGYGLWSERPDGAIVGGAMYLDRDFDRDDNRRRLLRDPRAGPRARVSARRVAHVDHEPGDWAGANRLRSGRRHRCVRASRREQEPRHRSGVDGAGGVDWCRAVESADDDVRVTQSAVVSAL